MTRLKILSYSAHIGKMASSTSNVGTLPPTVTMVPAIPFTNVSTNHQPQQLHHPQAQQQHQQTQVQPQQQQQLQLTTTNSGPSKSQLPSLVFWRFYTCRHAHIPVLSSKYVIFQLFLSPTFDHLILSFSCSVQDYWRDRTVLVVKPSSNRIA